MYQFLRALVGQRADLEEARGFHVKLETVVGFGVVPADGFEERGSARLGFFFVKHVEFIQHQPARFAVKFFIVFAQFVDDSKCFFGRVDGFVEGRQIDDVQQ